MADLELTVGPGAALLAAWLYYLGGGAALTAFLTAALAHELGHLAALLCLRAEVRRVRLTFAGPVLEYAAALTPGQEALAAAAGPVGGLLFAAGCFAAGTPYFRYAGLVALLGTAFNLLPAYPLDGGRLARLLLETSFPAETAARLTRAIGCLTAAGVCALGILWRAPIIAAAGVLLLVSAVKLR